MRRSRPNRILADTGPLYALIDSDDAHHERAHHELTAIQAADHAIIVPSPALFESYSLVLYRLGIGAAHRWLDEIRAGTGWLEPAPDDVHAAMLRLPAYPDQAISLFDATLAVMAERLHLEVWTFDHHFDALRVPVWRGR